VSGWRKGPGSGSPREMIAGLWRSRDLIMAMIRREVVGRYKGSVLGLLWSFFHPLLMLSVYTLVFGVVFKSRWGGGAGSNTEFALVLFAGLIVFNLFSECFTRAPSLILAHVNYVKKVVFPLEILPVAVLGAALFHTAVSTLVWACAYSLFFGLPHPTLLLLPVVLSPLCLVIIGVSWMLAALGVYLRDVTQFVGVVNTVLMFLSAIFYPLDALPGFMKKIAVLNPLVIPIEQARNVMYWGKLPDWWQLGIYCIASVVCAWLGFVFFQKARKGFADVL